MAGGGLGGEEVDDAAVDRKLPACRTIMPGVLGVLGMLEKHLRAHVRVSGGDSDMRLGRGRSICVLMCCWTMMTLAPQAGLTHAPLISNSC